jgi:hypothetical protein
MKTELQAKRARYIFDISRDLLNDFKAAVAINNTERNFVLLKFIRKYVAAEKNLLEAMKEKHEIAKDG